MLPQRLLTEVNAKQNLEGYSHYLGQWFSNFCMHQKHQIVGSTPQSLIQRVWIGTQEFCISNMIPYDAWYCSSGTTL